jgi:hypothetical protein
MNKNQDINEKLDLLAAYMSSSLTYAKNFFF